MNDEQSQRERVEAHKEQQQCECQDNQHEIEAKAIDRTEHVLSEESTKKGQHTTSPRY